MSVTIIALAIAAPFGFAIFFPDETERVFRWLWMFKTYVLGALSVIFALLFLSTGSLELMLLGAAIIATVVWDYWFNKGGRETFNV